MELAGATILFSPDNAPLYYRALNYLIRAFHLRQLGFRRYYEAEVPLNGLPKKGWIIWHPLHSNDKSSTEEYTTYAPPNVFRRSLKAANSLPLQKSLSWSQLILIWSQLIIIWPQLILICCMWETIFSGEINYILSWFILIFSLDHLILIWYDEK